MYVLKQLGYNHLDKRQNIENGIGCMVIDEPKRIIPTPGFWGETEIHFDDFVDMSKFGNGRYAGELLIPYVSEYFVEDKADNNKKFSFSVSSYEPDNIEGYIVFSKNAYVVETDGEKLFQRYPAEIVAVLKEGQYLKYDGGRVEVNKGRLMLVI